jgi:tetratricopeptide (TPR) repeat protein
MTSFLLAVALFAGCAAEKSEKTSFADSSSWSASELIAAARDAAHASMKEKNRGEAKDLAERGMEFAERCLMSAPEEPGCYYWRAVNTGLYYRIHIIGYQKGIKRMISDCDKVISLDPKYDQAGAYRMLGEIYAQLPETAGRPDSITRDLDTAEDFLLKAVRTAPGYPENHIAMADVLFKQEKFTQALESLVRAKELTPHWRTDISYEDWKNTTFDLEKKLARSGK